MSFNGFSSGRDGGGHRVFSRSLVQPLVIMFIVATLVPQYLSLAGPSSDPAGNDVSRDIPFEMDFQEPGTNASFEVQLLKERRLSGVYAELEGLISEPMPRNSTYIFDSTNDSGKMDHRMFSGQSNGTEISNAIDVYMIDETPWSEFGNLSARDDVYVRTFVNVDGATVDSVVPFHHFVFDIEVPLSNADQWTYNHLEFSWQGYGMHSNTDAMYYASIYIWHDADGVWKLLKDFSNADTSGDIDASIQVTADIPGHFVNGSNIHCMVVGPVYHSGDNTTVLTLATDYVSLTFDWMDMTYPTKVSMDVGNDGSVDWYNPGPLIGTYIVTDQVALEGTLQSLIDAAGPGPGDLSIPISFSADSAGKIRVNAFNMSYFGPGVPAFGLIPNLTLDEDTFGDDVLDLRDVTMDEYGPDNLTFALWVSEDAANVTVSLDDDGHHIDLLPKEDWSGEHVFRVWASNRHNMSALSQPIQVFVMPVNDPPDLLWFPNTTIKEGEAFQMTLEAFDVDKDELTFFDDTDLFDVDPVNGSIHFVPGEDDDGLHEIVLGVTDGHLNDTKMFIMTVEEVDDPPRFEDIRSDWQVLEDSVLDIQVRAVDPEGWAVTYDISPHTFPIDDEAGMVHIEPGGDQVGIHHLTVTASANGLSASLELTVTVLPFNDAPEIIGILVTSIDGGDDLREDTGISFVAEVIDEEGGTGLLYSWVLDDGTTLSEDISFIANMSAGSYNVTFKVIDGEHAVSLKAHITVRGIEPPPPPPPPPRPPTRPRPIRISDPETATTISMLVIIGAAGAVVVGTEVGKFGFFFFFAPLFSRIKKEEALDSFTRGKIYGTILTEPGISYNLLREITGVGNGTLAHHLKVLESTGYIIIRRDGLYKRFYPREGKLPKSHKVLSKIQRLILQTIMDCPGITQTEVADVISVRRQVANYHIKKLENMNLVDLEKVGNVARCHANIERIRNAHIDFSDRAGDAIEETVVSEGI